MICLHPTELMSLLWKIAFNENFKSRHLFLSCKKFQDLVQSGMEASQLLETQNLSTVLLCHVQWECSVWQSTEVAQILDVAFLSR